MATERDMFDALIQHQVYSYRVSTAVVNEIQEMFNSSSNKIISEIRNILDDLTDLEKTAFVAGNYNTDDLKELKSLFGEWVIVLNTSIPEALIVSSTALVSYESVYVSKLYGEELALSAKKIISNANKKPVVDGLLFNEIWKNLGEKVRRESISIVREGVDNGLTTQQIVQSLRGERIKKNGKYKYVGGLVNKTKSQIESDVRTIRSHYSQVAYSETFSALGFDYVKDVATLDGRTSLTCISVDGRVQKVDARLKAPPYHRRCRTIQIGCDKEGSIDGKRPYVEDTEAVKNIPKGERADKIGQVDANVTYKDWFERLPENLQKDILGSTRFKLWESGEIALDKFVDDNGKPISIADLRQLDEKAFERLGL